MADTVDTLRRDTIGNPRARSGWNIAFGIWLVISPFILGFAALTQAMQTDIVVGLIVFVMALIGTGAAAARWTRVVNIIAGIWLFVSPFVLGFATTATNGASIAMTATWNSLILGALVIIFGSFSLSSATKLHHGAHGRHAYQ